MDFQFYFKKMQSSEALKQMAIKKITERLAKYTNPTQKVHITFYEDGPNHSLNCGLSTLSGARFYAEATSDNMYNAIDMVAAKLRAQFERRKTKLQDHHKRFNPHKESFIYPVREATAAPDGMPADMELEAIDAEDIIKWEASSASTREQLKMQFAH